MRTFITQNEIEAAFIMSGTGDLTRANIQFPSKMVDVFMGQYHIISLSGTLSCNYGVDLKIALADEEVMFCIFVQVMQNSPDHIATYFRVESLAELYLAIMLLATRRKL